MSAIAQTSATEPSRREAALTDAPRMIIAMMRCIFTLIREGIPVVGFTGERKPGENRITITVAPSPYLYSLFEGQCACIQRRKEGHLTVFTWHAINEDGIRIKWEEACAFPMQ